MERLNGYQILAGILTQKFDVMPPEIVGEVARLVHFNSSEIANKPACRELLLNFTMWRQAPENLALPVAKHISRCVRSGPFQEANITVLRELGCVSQFLDVLRDPQLAESVARELVAVLGTMFRASFAFEELKRINHFLLSTLPTHFNTRKVKECSAASTDPVQIRAIFVRNLLLELMLHLCRMPDSAKYMSEFFLRNLGPEWLMQFLEPSVDDTTVTLALRIFGTLVQDDSSSFLSKFKSTSWGGYSALSELLCGHCHIGEVYLLLFALLLGHDVGNIPAGLGPLKLAHLHETFQFALGAKPTVAHGEAIAILLGMVREMHLQYYASGKSGQITPGTPVEAASPPNERVSVSSNVSVEVDTFLAADGLDPAMAVAIEQHRPQADQSVGREQGAGNAERDQPAPTEHNEQKEHDAPAATSSAPTSTSLPSPHGRSGKPPNPFEVAPAKPNGPAGNPFTSPSPTKPPNPIGSAVGGPFAADVPFDARHSATTGQGVGAGETSTVGAKDAPKGLWSKAPWPTMYVSPEIAYGPVSKPGTCPRCAVSLIRLTRHLTCVCACACPHTV